MTQEAKLFSFKGVITPRQVAIEESSHTDRYAKFVVEPLERGYGDTLGNAMRRVLLSSIPGTALTGVKIEGVLQEVSYIPGVVEDVTEIVLNLCSLVFRLEGNKPTSVLLNATGPCQLTGFDVQPNPDVEILNPEQTIATLEEGGHLEIEMIVDRGIGYVPAESHEGETDVTLLPVDSVFTPIRRVKYHVEDTRVGQITDYDRLVMEVWTDGTIKPEDAVAYAGKILKDHLALFITFEIGISMEFGEEAAVESEINLNLLKTVEELELSVRSYNCLKAANIRTIADLVQKNEHDMLKYRNFGKKSLIEIRELLDRMNLRLNMELDEETLQKIGDMQAEAANVSVEEENEEPGDEQ